MRPPPERFETTTGARIYRLPLAVFPGFWGYSHLVLADGFSALVDVGSGFGNSHGHLEAGLNAVREKFGEGVRWGEISHLLITHGHIDHFGGLRQVLPLTSAQVVIHSLDLGVLRHFEERLSITSRRLSAYLRMAGVDEKMLDELMQMYLLNKQLFSSVEVDATYADMGMRIGPIRVIHVPGHCPGQVVLQLDQFLLSGDHILERTTPHQAPEQLSLYTGLGHYLDSLEKLLPLAETIQVTLGGHENPIHDLQARILEIRDMHMERLAGVLSALEEPRTIFELARELFGELDGYDELLAIEEAGAHVEYLADRGMVRLANWQTLEEDLDVPWQFVRAEEGAASPMVTMVESRRQDEM